MAGDGLNPRDLAINGQNARTELSGGREEGTTRQTRGTGSRGGTKKGEKTKTEARDVY